MAIFGHEVQRANDGATALAAAETFQPQAVILDIGMPDMDGYQVAERIRSRAPHVLLVAVTGYGQDEDRRRTHAAGFDHHLTKPVDGNAPQELLAVHAHAPRS